MLDDAIKYIKSIKFDHLKIFLILLFSILYLPHCFILNEDLGLLIAYDNDSGSMSEAIIGIMADYNFHNYLHAKFYGWTYFVINYILLKPLDLFLDVFAFGDSEEIMLFSIKLVLFTISLLSVIVFNEVLLKIFDNNKFYAFLGSSLYILSGDVGNIFYSIRPETTGLLFLFLAILSLLNFIERNKNPDYKHYFYGLAFLILSCLSKQIFFFTALPILLSFTAIIIKNEGLTSKKFIEVVKYSLLITFVITLIINPFLIFDFQKMLDYQIELAIHHNNSKIYNPIPMKDLFIGWMMLIKSIPIICLYFVSVIFTYIATIYIINKKLTRKNLLFLNMTMSIYVIFTLIFLGNNLYIIPRYVAPIYPFCIIYFLVIVKYFSDNDAKNLKILRNILYFILLILYFLILLQSMYHSIINTFKTASEHKKSLAYISYEYALENFDTDDKIIYGPFTAIPSYMNKNSCNYWFHGKCLSKMKPEYIILIKDFSTNGGMFVELKEINQYIKKNNFKLINEITDGRIGFDEKISVYRNLGNNKNQ